MELKERIKKARKMRGYKSQEKLAELLGTTRNAITEYEMGRVIPNDVFLQLMAAKLNISYEWLKEGKGDMEAQPSGIESVLDRLDGEDVDVVKIYAELPHEHKMILKEFARKVASATKPKDTAPAKEPHAFTEQELEVYEKVKAAKEKEDAAFEAETAALHRQLDMERAAEKKDALESFAISSDTATLIGKKILAASPTAQAEVTRIIEEGV